MKMNIIRVAAAEADDREFVYIELENLAPLPQKN